jgi:uncharacterized protein DUF1059
LSIWLLNPNSKLLGPIVDVMSSTHTMYGETEEELLANAKKHGIEVHGYTEETWNDEVSKNAEHFRKLIKQS